MSGELEGKKILVVDDDRDILTAIEAALEDLGPEIHLATNGDEGIKLAEREEPDLVILDQNMPRRSGFLVLDRLRRGKDPDSKPAVVMITANEGARHRLYAEAQGVQAYLNKPFRMEKLVEAVTNLLS